MSKYITKQRKILQNYLSNRIDEELSARKVAEDLAHENLSLSAIYRNIADMEKEKIVVQCRKEGSREIFFRYVNDNCHKSIHIYCNICNKIEHISIQATQEILNNINNSTGFNIDIHSAMFYGICKSCEKNNKLN